MKTKLNPTAQKSLRASLASEHARLNARGIGIMRFSEDGTPHPANDDPEKVQHVLMVSAVPSGRFLFLPLSPVTRSEPLGRPRRPKLVDAPPSPVPERSAPTAVTQEAPRWQPPEDPDAAFLAKYGM